MASHTRTVNVVGRWSAITFLAAAICFVVVVALRWWGPCRWGDWESIACWERQDDSWDDALRDAPGIAPELAAQAGGYILFGVAVVLLGVASRKGGIVVAGALSGLLLILQGLVVVQGALEGVPADPLIGVAMILFTVPCAVLAGAPLLLAARSSAAWLALFVGLMCTNVMTDYFITSAITYASHDTPPWMYSPTTLGLLTCAVTVWLLSGARPR